MKDKTIRRVNLYALFCGLWIVFVDLDLQCLSINKLHVINLLLDTLIDKGVYNSCVQSEYYAGNQGQEKSYQILTNKKAISAYSDDVVN